MLEKYIPIEETDPFTSLPNVVRFHPEHLEKTAGVAGPVQEFLTTLKPDPNFIYLIVNALGSGEFYGANRNNDWFGEEELKKTHGTFVTDAKVFKHHKNKAHDQSYGNVLFSYYHPEMHRIELVITLDRRLAPDIAQKIDDGEYPGVSMGTKVKFDVCLDKNSLIFTNNELMKLKDVEVGDYVSTHEGQYKKVLNTSRTLTDSYIKVGVWGDYLNLNGTLEHPLLVAPKEQFKEGKTTRLKALKSEYPKFEWKILEDIKVGDYLVFRKSKKMNPVLNKNIARLLGYYISEGFLLKQRAWRNKKGPIKVMGVIFSFSLSEKDSYVKEVKTLLKEEFDLTAKIYEYPQKNECRIQVYSKLFANLMLKYGGEYSKTKFINPKIFNEPDEILLNILGAAISGDGSQDHNTHCGTIRYTTVSESLARGIRKICFELSIPASVNRCKQKSSFGTSVVYNVHIPSSCSSKLEKYSEKLTGYDKSRASRFFCFNDHILIPVNSVTKVEDYLEVVNLQIEDDESYLVQEYISHNCSICNHKSKTMADYCDHLKRPNGGKIDVGTGKKAFAINPNPKFFDISFVRINADRTAYTMKKVAGVQESKQATITKKIPAAIVAAGSTPKEVLIRASQNDMPESLIKDLTKTADLGTLLRTLLGMRALPTKTDFQNIVLYNSNKESLAKYLNRQGRIFPNTDGPIDIDIPKTFDMSIVDKILETHPEVIHSKPVIIARIIRMTKKAAKEQEIEGIPELTKIAGLYQWYIREFNKPVDHGPLLKNAQLVKLLYPRNALFIKEAAGVTFNVDAAAPYLQPVDPEIEPRGIQIPTNRFTSFMLEKRGLSIHNLLDDIISQNSLLVDKIYENIT